MKTIIIEVDPRAPRGVMYVIEGDTVLERVVLADRRTLHDSLLDGIRSLATPSEVTVHLDPWCSWKLQGSLEERGYEVRALIPHALAKVTA